MGSKEQQEKLKFFVKTGIVVLSFLVIMMLGIRYIPKAVSVTNSANTKKLPIYCVDKKENKVALSFDAAWGMVDKDSRKLPDCGCFLLHLTHLRKIATEVTVHQY